MESNKALSDTELNFLSANFDIDQETIKNFFKLLDSNCQNYPNLVKLLESIKGSDKHPILDQNPQELNVFDEIRKFSEGKNYLNFTTPKEIRQVLSVF
jgi:hypothetical protein